MSRIKTFFCHPIVAFKSYWNDRFKARIQRKQLLSAGVYDHLSDKKAIEVQYFWVFGKKPNLRHPKTLSEKLQWIKLYDRRPEYISMVDKYEAKKFVAERIGEEYVVPTLGIWDRAEDIDFDALPEQFVLKCTHDSGSVIICKEKKSFDSVAALKKLNECLQKSQFPYGREWPYLGVKPRIIAEPYLVDESGTELKDYKVFCFNGEAKYLDVHFNRFIGHKQNHYDFDWNALPFTFASVPNDYSVQFPKPHNLEKMKQLSELLSRDVPFLRVDFYSICDRLYIGELTFFPGAALGVFEPHEWDERFGSWLTLPKKKRTGKISLFRRVLLHICNRLQDRQYARTIKLLSPGKYEKLSDRRALKLKYRYYLGSPLNLRHPKTYSEKLQWLKLYDRRPEYITMVDKYAVKEYIAKKIGSEYVVPLLGVWERAEDIDFDALPEQFVLKTNHDTANVLVCKDKSTFDRKAAIEHLSACLKTDSFIWGREWPYQNVKRCVFAEAFLKDDKSDDLPDYKFFCFDGKVRFFLIATDRHKAGEKTKLDFFYPDGTHIDTRYGYPNAKTPPPLPSKFEEMKRLAEILSNGIPHVRVDFYECNGKVYFGELTFYTGCGFIPFTPREMDKIFGEFLTLPKKKRRGKTSFFRRTWHHFIDPLKDKQCTRMVDLLTPGNCEKLPDKKLLKLKYLQLFEKKLDLRHPKTFSEKLQWLKLYDRRPEYIPMVDKFEVKKIVAEKIGKEYVVPTLGVWNKANDIDFDALPEQFVLKCTHDSGSIVICKNKKDFDQEAARQKLAGALKQSAFYYGREWPYLGVKPRIIAEPYLVDESGWELKDYKIFCFNGKANYLDIHFDRFTEHKQNHYDFEWNPLPFTFASVPNDYSIDFPKPKNLEQMKKIAETLSRDIPFLRVDLYNVCNRLYVGELTFYPGSGFSRFDPPEWDETFGSWLTLPKHKTKAKSIHKYQ